MSRLDAIRARLERRHYADGARERTEVLWMNEAATNGQGRMEL